jgi:small subunit ribosomal protein S15
MLTKRKKENVMKEVRIHADDSGSSEVQIALLTRRITDLAAHLKKHAKDKHSRRGLLQLVADRQKLTRYLKKKSDKRYKSLAKKIGLKAK